MKKLKVLNLYAGIGGNRKLWENVEVTAIENNLEIAEIYHDFFPEDIVIVDDAHEYLLQHFKEYDFIWSSIPCPSHSRLNTASFPKGSRKYEYPDLKLYEEVIFLKHWFHGVYCIENVIPYYNPLIIPQVRDRHCFWANFIIIKNKLKEEKESHEISQIPYLQDFMGFNLDKYTLPDKRQVLRNCVIPDLGKHILECARAKMENRKIKAKQQDLFI